MSEIPLHWLRRAVPLIDFGSALNTALAAYLYQRFAGPGMPSEVYLRGATPIAAVESRAGALIHKEASAFSEFFGATTAMGRFQSRGPETWALAFPQFVTSPGVMPSRQSIFDRDEWLCCYCGADLKQTQAHIDHVFPKSKGGWDDAANLVAACQRCNCGKRDRSALTWKGYQL